MSALEAAHLMKDYTALELHGLAAYLMDAAAQPEAHVILACALILILLVEGQQHARTQDLEMMDIAVLMILQIHGQQME